VTPQALQVFYRDESQGILLGAVKTSNGWVYEIVDGDKDSEGRTTGDVAFHLSATAEKNTVYLLYDSVLAINSNREPASGEVRLAKRRTVFPEDWRYQTLDGPGNGVTVAGYAISSSKSRSGIMATWLSSTQGTSVIREEIAYLSSLSSEIRRLKTFDEFGEPHLPLAIYPKGIIFACESRICHLDFASNRMRLLSGRTKFDKYAVVLTLNAQSIAITLREGSINIFKL
jgi:hypothetical protein